MNPSLSTSKPAARPSTPMLRAAGIMGACTAASRVLGFLRDALIAAAYGTSPPAQAFVVAFRVPNLLRDLAGEGASNSAFVPVLTRTRALEGEASWARLAQALWVRLLVWTALVSAAGVLLAPLAVRLIAPGFQQDQELFQLTVRLTRILFPFIGLVAIAAFFMAALNSVQQFTLPSLGPALLNVCMIAGMFAWRRDALGLAWGVIAGGLVQLAVQWPGLRRAGLRLDLRPARHPGVGEIGRLMGPRVIGSGVYQISVLVDTVFASFPQLVGEGGIAALYFAHRFLHLPLALFGISMAQAALPAMASQAALKDTAAIRRTCVLAMRSSLLIAVPASVGLIFLGTPIVRTMLERGEFSPDATAKTVSTLQWYALGLSSMCAAKVLSNTLYAFQDTWTPVRSAALALGVNMALNFLLVWPMQLAGLALATSAAALLNSLHLYRAVCRQIGPFGRELAPWLVRVAAASLGMGIIALSTWGVGVRNGWTLATAPAIGWLFASVGFGALSFFLLGHLLEVQEARDTIAWLRTRIRRSPKN